VIDLLITKHLAEFYAQQLRTRHGVDPELKLTQADESIEEMFQRALSDARALEPRLKRVKDTDVHAVVADMRAVQASGALPPTHRS